MLGKVRLLLVRYAYFLLDQVSSD